MNHLQRPNGIFALVVNMTSSAWSRDLKLTKKRMLSVKLQAFEAVHLYCCNISTVVLPCRNSDRIYLYFTSFICFSCGHVINTGLFSNKTCNMKT